MLWDMLFLAFAVALFLGTFFLFRWGHDKRALVDKDTWKFTDYGSGGV